MEKIEITVYPNSVTDIDSILKAMIVGEIGSVGSELRMETNFRKRY